MKSPLCVTACKARVMSKAKAFDMRGMVLETDRESVASWLKIISYLKNTSKEAGINLSLQSSYRERSTHFCR
jgi:hypothetical protein